MNRFETIRQHDSEDCGVACLAMICRYYNRNYSIQYLRKITGTNQEGTSVFTLIETAKKIGLSAVSLKGKCTELKQYLTENKSPSILHLKTNHYIVLYKIKGNKLLINDPAEGRKLITWKELEQEWSGYLISFKEIKHHRKIHADNKNTKTTFVSKLLIQNLFPLIIISICSFIIMSLTLCSAYLFQIMLDYGGFIYDIHGHNNTNLFINVLL